MKEKKQKGLHGFSMKISADIRDAIDKALAKVPYSQKRTQFIRDAIYEKIDRIKA